MTIYYSILSIGFILILIFILVLYLTTLSVYNEINVNTKNINPYDFINNFKIILKENKLDNYRYNYNSFITIVPNSIGYEECVKQLTFKYEEEYIPETELENLINELINYYRNQPDNNVGLLLEFFEDLLKNTVITDIENYIKQLAA